MSRLTDLLRDTKQLDPQLGRDLEEVIIPLQKRLPFGLNFERHAPEAVELAGHAIRLGSKVRILPPRGSKERGDQRLWGVRSIAGESAQVSLLDAAEDEQVDVATDDLILVAEFRERIYPGLRPDGTVERGGDKPFHTVINGENFHVLEQLTFTHENAVDAIYIDPPYNSGASDWKYNNDYVEGDDLYRHSKWLAFMERRLKLAKRLLKPEGSVLIVTIDEKEVHRLGLLLQQVFDSARVQMVTTVTNQRGVARDQEFARVDEYAFVVFIGNMQVSQGPDDMLTSDETTARQRIDIWNRLMRRGTDSLRADSPRQFFPIFIDPVRKAIVSVGQPLAPEQSRESVTVPDDLVVVWPLRTNGAEGRWTLGADTLRKYVGEGKAKLGAYSKARDTWSISYLISKDIQRIESGEIRVVGADANGVLQLELADGVARQKLPRTVWNRDAHNAGSYGSELLGRLVPGRRFPFPKSLYLVEDMLRVFVGSKPDAVVVDFFAGSATTAHAVMRLNRQDGGRRQSILVTNNEVSADEQVALRKMGLRPGDAEWEQWGICDFITKPRIRAAISGNTPDGQPIRGDYKFTDEFPMADGFDENAAFFTLMYESPWRVSTDRAFAAVAPMLWLRAGAQGPRIDEIAGGWAVAETYGIINDLDRSTEFIAALNDAADIRIAYIVTDDEGRYQQVADEIRGIETVRLYEDYLRNCESTGDL